MAPRKWGSTTRPSAAKRGYGYAWQVLRSDILKRDKRLCQQCIKAGRTVMATDVDHIVPKHRGGTDNPGNLQSLCGDCHRAKSAREGQKARY